MRTPILSNSILSVLLVCGLSATSCHLFKSSPPEVWEESEIALLNQKVLFEGVVLALRKEGFKVGTGAEPALGRVQSAWRVNASPFKGKGYRERAILNFGPSEENPGQSFVRVRIERDTNESLRPLLEGSAKWEDAPDPPDVPRRVLQYVHSYLDAEDLVPE